MNFSMPLFPKTQLERINEIDKNEEDKIMITKTLNFSETIYNILKTREILPADMVNNFVLFLF